MLMKQKQKSRVFYHGFCPKRVVLALLAAFMLVLASGCLRAPQQGEPGGTAPAVVTLWHTLQGPEAAALQAQTDGISKSNPAILIRLKYVPEQSFAALAYQAEAGGEGPELFLAPRAILWQLYAKGAISPVVQYTSDSYPAALAQFRFGDKLYAQPLLTDLPLLYYRTDGGSAPTSLTDLSKGSLVLPQVNTQVFSAWWTAQGGKASAQGKPQLNAPENLAFLQQLLAWRDGGALRVDPNAFNLLAAGGARFTIAYASQAPMLTRLNIPWNALALNSLTGGQGQVLLGPTLGIANSSIKAVAAMVQPIRLVEEAMLGPSVEGALAQAGGRFPVSSGYYQKPEAQQGIFLQVSQSLTKAWPLEGSALDWRLFPILDMAWQNAWAGSQNPVDLLSAAQAQGEAEAAKK